MLPKFNTEFGEVVIELPVKIIVLGLTVAKFKSPPTLKLDNKFIVGFIASQVKLFQTIPLVFRLQDDPIFKVDPVVITVPPE